MNVRATEFLRLEHGLRRALDNAEFELCYQPQINLTSGKVEAVEALLRWRQLDGSMQLPDSFLPVLEETGLVVPVGEWVLKEACQQMVQWRKTGLAPDHVAVNISGRQLSTPGLVKLIEETLEQSGLSPKNLMLEITESSLIQDTDRAIDQLTQLSKLGIKLAIDDFGTGYSSLEHLQRFPIHILKIDRSFVQNMEINKDRAAIVTAIISLAKIMELDVVAEGVETEHQKMLLKELGCDLVQGFLFGDAVAGAEIKFSNISMLNYPG
ncbi:MAG: EAL domain-containing protein [gamma proteobacterium endosymbiont of Lamellibrachia anaximandri]|nr:EAL domain-containing protein [gamma proteobacterium endosymbiont of Lamellibrachia anaximandri]